MKAQYAQLVFDLSMIGAGKEKEYFMENLATLIDSGMGVSAVLESMGSEMRTSAMQKVIADLREDVDAGSPIWKALQKSDFLPERSTTLVRIGEESGKLSENLKVLVEQQQKERVFAGKIRSAMMYPVLVLALTASIGTGIAWFILPRLASVFLSLRLKLPLITQWLIAIGNFLGKYGAIVIPVLILAIGLVAYFVFIFPKTRHIGHWIFLHTPMIKKLIQDSELSRFGYLFGTLLEAGLPVVQALKSISEATVFYNYRHFYQYLASSIEGGNSFRRSFEEYPHSAAIIPVPIQQLVGAAERSGHLSQALKKIGTIFEDKTENTTKNLSVVLEPLLLVIVWGGVVMVALAVILPIYNLIGGLQQQTDPQAASAPETAAEEPLPERAAEIPGETAAMPVSVALKKVTVKPTELGYLNVRSLPSAQGTLVARIKPGESYPYGEERGGWYKIELPDSASGWVSGTYVEIVP